ncbi:PTS 2-O-a-mannosyl-D-glycerate transporter subunit IIABC [Superficieibacter electus]|uniref:protein-N(pi)-phosphohistidine--D-fructose phosphotransferase n=1 Tax=Superficieibacter electus TaxID=2022662 RepID=A0A2P5GL52_9ENTR|nr:fructose-specific PTS transporter subunit EIIC [Superficieibacter electus]POP42673.1 PTS 2-O-a-mannosyl-D-glycerate transporter subunit IIABC [Superficieibacter electus]POP45749.1 PTS 2-O-a-mannosyl-D-glycerate transporter subunit IIABC [Superficieibacter electus]
MQLSALTNTGLIVLNSDLDNKDDIIRTLARKLFESGKLTSEDAFLQAVYEREALGETGMGGGLALPHGKSTAVKEACFAVMTTRKAVQDWESFEDDGQVRHIFLLAIPASESGSTHLALLAKLMQNMGDEEYSERLFSAQTPELFYQYLDTPVADEETTGNFQKSLVAVTACPAGVAHTYMAADALVKAGRELGVNIYVEKQGANGIEGRHTVNHLKTADAAIFAVSVAVKDVERFAHLPQLKVSVSDPIKDAKGVILQALKQSELQQKGEFCSPQNEEPAENTPSFIGRMLNEGKGHLMTGVSFMLPFVVAGGLILTIGLLLGGSDQKTGMAHTAIQAGVLIFSLMVPVIAGYISYSIADKPGIVVGMAGGLIAREIGAGFLGGIVAGFIAGFIVNQLKRIPMHAYLTQLKPIIIIPLLGSGLIVLIMYIIGVPIARLSVLLEGELKALQGGNLIVLGIIIGGMMAVDMGGPINKVAFAFCAGMLGQGVYAPMAACWIGIMTPPVGLAVATWLAPKKFSAGEKSSSIATAIMGLTGITEGAIPFAVADPWRVILSIVIGSAAGAALALGLGVEASVPSGGIFVVPFFHHPMLFILAFLVGIAVTALSVITLKKDYVDVN